MKILEKMPKSIVRKMGGDHFVSEASKSGKISKLERDLKYLAKSLEN